MIAVQDSRVMHFHLGIVSVRSFDAICPGLWKQTFSLKRILTIIPVENRLRNTGRSVVFLLLGMQKNLWNAACVKWFDVSEVDFRCAH